MVTNLSKPAETCMPQEALIFHTWCRLKRRVIRAGSECPYRSRNMVIGTVMGAWCRLAERLMNLLIYLHDIQYPGYLP